MEIESPTNPRIRAALALRERRERDRTGLTLVDGGRESLRAIEAGVAVETAFVCLELVSGTTPDARARLNANVDSDAALAVRKLGHTGAAIVPVSRRAFDRLAYGDRADGIVLVVRAPAAALGDLDLGPDPLIVITEDVEKPGNLGAILRSADGAGAAAVIAVGGTDLYNPNVIRASTGTIFAVAVVAATASETMSWLRERRVRIVAAKVDAGRLYSEADLTGPLALVLGSEATGLSPAWDGAGVEAIHLPMLGAADSLNVAATAAVLLYEARRQRGLPAPQST
jgi:TrmH family RNA methyltransferase